MAVLPVEVTLSEEAIRVVADLVVIGEHYEHS